MIIKQSNFSNGFVVMMLVFSIASCNNKNEENKNVNDVIVACIKETLGVGDSAKMSYRYSTAFLPDTLPDATSINKRLQMEHDSLKKILDTTYTYIRLNDSLIRPEKEGLVAYQDLLPKLKERQLDIDKWNDATMQLLDLKYISKQTQLNISNTSKNASNDIGAIGSFYFSKVLFNRDSNRAAVCENYYCGVKCGYEMVLILEKNKEQWKVITKEWRTKY